MKKRLAILFLSLLVALNSNIQVRAVLEKADLSFHSKILSEVLTDLSKKFNVDIVLTDKANQQITCSVKAVNIEEALNLILCGTNFDFTKPSNKKEAYLIFKTEKPSCRIGKQSQMFPLTNLEANHAINLLPEHLKKKASVINEQNSILAEGPYNDLKELEEFISTIDKPLNQVELEVKVIELKRNALKDIRLFRDGLSLNTVSTGRGAVIFQQSIGPPQDLGFLIGKITNGLSIFDFSSDTWKIFNRQLSYLESIGLAQLHAYPKLSTISGRTATININTDSNLVLGFAQGVPNVTTEGDQTGVVIGVASTQHVGTIKAGTNLHITPVLGKENLITTKITVEVSENSDSSTRQNGVLVPTTTFRREINTDVQIKDGQTVAIGGLIINNRTVNRRGLPFITSIPILGDILSNRRSTKDQSELIVLITPRVRNISQETIVLRKPYESIIEKELFESEKEKTSPKKKRKWFLFRWW